MTLSFRKLAPHATQDDRRRLAIGLRELRRKGLVAPAAERHSMRMMIREVIDENRRPIEPLPIPADFDLAQRLIEETRRQLYEATSCFKDRAP